MENPDHAMADTIKRSLDIFLGWLDKHGYRSFDHYDIWASELGVFSKRLFHRNRHLGFPLVAPLYVIDSSVPGLRRFFSQKRVYAEAMPYFAMGFFRLFESEGNPAFLMHGIDCLTWLRDNRSQSKSGSGWGLPFDWPNRSFVPKDTPCVTITSYGTDAFLKGYELTKDESYLDIAVSTAEFALHDLNIKTIDEDRIAVSYTPVDNMIVVNANTYCAKILYDVWGVTGREEYISFADKVINYVLDEQNEDGSWFYWGKEQEGENFIDNFHTCFVLENLNLIFQKSRDERIRRTVEKGYAFFISNFINSDYSCKHFYMYPNFTGVKVDIRSCAETIYCLTMLSGLFPEAMDAAHRVVMWTIGNMQDPRGYFYFRTYRAYKNKMPYMRWGQGPMFNALTYLYQKTNGGQHA